MHKELQWNLELRFIPNRSVGIIILKLFQICCKIKQIDGLMLINEINVNENELIFTVRKKIQI